MFKRISALLAAAVATLFAGGAGAQNHDMSNHTTPGQIVKLAEWSKRMQTELERNLVYPVAFGGQRLDGVVRVKFNCSDNGRPDKVTLLKSSGSTLTDRAAMRAVSKMASLHPLPTGFKPTTRYEAIVVFATDAQDSRLNVSATELKKRNSWYHDPEVAAVARELTVAAR